MADVEALKKDWEGTYPLALAFADELEQQFSRILADAKIALAVPVQKRVKTWGSLEEKLGRKSLELEKVSDLHDLIGLRIILLFRRDVETACKLLNQHLRVKEQFDAGERLAEDQFGYESTHLIVTLPDAWLNVPTFSRLAGLVAEVQVRTAAQHAWAAASHVLQYKVESSVPPSVRRSINRVSALLETVDLEFERVLDERNEYREHAMDDGISEELNVDLLEKLLDHQFPNANKIENEDYSSLILDLASFNVTKSDQLTALIKTHEKEIIRKDQETASKNANDASLDMAERTRASTGVWFTHTGLVRELMKLEFGSRWTAHREGSRKLISTRLGK